MIFRRLGNEQGFVLAAAILAMVVVGAAVAAGYFIGNQEYHVGKSVRQSASAFYAAEAGIQREYGTWSIPDRWTMEGGDSLAVGPVTLPNGTAYRGTVTRVDNTPETDTDTERYYLIRMTGLAPAPVVGEEVQNNQALLLRVRYYDFCCTGALTVKDSIKLAGNALVDGNNADPLVWGAECDSVNTADLPGLEVQCTTCWEDMGSNVKTYGTPPVDVDTTLQSQTLTDWDEITWDFLVSKAEKVYPPDADVTTLAPAVTIDPMTGLPVCDESVLNNWGEPTNPLHVCFDYFPIIYASGSMKISSGDYGQGILLVEGDLKMTGGFSFWGLVIVRGHIEATGQAGKIYGAAIVAAQNTGLLDESKIAGSGSVTYSSCALTRAKRYGALAKMEPLPLRSWIEALQ